MTTRSNQRSQEKKPSNLEHVVINGDGVVSLNLEKQETHKKVWHVIQQFKDIKVEPATS